MDEALCESAFTSCAGDGLSSSRQVATLMTSDIVNTAFNIAWIYNVLINQFGNVAVLASADWRKLRRIHPPE